MLVFDVHRIFGLAKAMVKSNQQNTNVSSQLSVILGVPVASGLLQLKQINSLGDIYIREKFWEESLEVLYVVLLCAMFLCEKAMFDGSRSRCFHDLSTCRRLYHG